MIIVPTQINMGIKGYFRMRTINKFSGKVTSDTGWFPNTILDAGRNIMSERSDWMNYCQVGTDGNFPLLLSQRQAETSLSAHHAGTNALTPAGATWGQSGSAPYYGWKRKTWRFPEGTVAAILAEVAVGWDAGPGSTIITRAPVLDPVLETPTTVTPLIDELLEVMYELRYYAPTEDVIGPQVTLDGVVYDTITRAASVTGDQWSQFIGSAIGVDPGTDWAAFSDNIGTVLTAPGGTSAACDTSSQTNAVYSNNSYEIVMNTPVGIQGWNVSGGIRSVRIRTTAGDFQTQFNEVATVDPAGKIPKSSDYTMFMSWTLSWAEYIAPWVAGTYALGDRATHVGFTWQSTTINNTSEPGVADWVQI